jgi:hypothetical protein
VVREAAGPAVVGDPGGDHIAVTLFMCRLDLIAEEIVHGHAT